MSDQTLLQFKHAGTVLALIGSLIFVNHKMSLHVTESVVPLVTGGALVHLHFPSVLLGMQSSQKILVAEVLAHYGEFSTVLIYAVLSKIEDDVIVWTDFLPTFLCLVFLYLGFLSNVHGFQT